MINKKLQNKIPNYVVYWTDKYFHQSAFDVPLRFPSKKVITYLSKFKKEEKIKLLRGVHKYNKDSYTGIHSWTYDIEVASRYANEISGKVIEKLFEPEKILLDTTILNSEEKKFLGYDYKIDDKEVLVII